MCIELERETDGRWIAEITELPGVMTYGNLRITAVLNVIVLAIRYYLYA